MVQKLRIRRAAAGGFVLLLHGAVLLALLAAFQPQLFEQTVGTREIIISLPVTARARETPPPNQLPPPSLLVPEISPRPITPPSLLTTLSLPAGQQQEQQGDIRALGRYLYNCSGQYFERLSAKEKAHCLENKFNGQEGPALTLGPGKPSPYDAVIAKRNAPAVPIEHPCSIDKPTANLGLPCYDFGSSHQPLVEFHH